MHLSLKGSLNTKFPRFKDILDTYAGSAAAYSLRKLSSSTTNVVRVRRASDNSEQDFTAADVSSGAMTDWVGSAEWDDDASSDSTSNWETVDSTISHSVDKYVLTYTATTQWAILNTTPNLINNNPITISVDVKNGTSGNAAVYLGASNIGTGNQTLGQIGTTSDSWQTLTATFNATSYTFNKPSIRFDMTSGTVEFKNFSISQTGDGFVPTWYDQSGNGNDAVQQVSGSQPKIVDAGVLVSGGLDFDGSPSAMDIDGLVLESTEYYMTAVIHLDAVPSNSLKTIFDCTDAVNAGASLAYANTSSQLTPFMFDGDDTSVNVFGGGANLTTSKTLVGCQFKSGASESYINGGINSTLSNTWTSAGTNTFTKSTIGYDQSTPGRNMDGKLAELIVYESDQSANRAAIEANINNQYDIY